MRILKYLVVLCLLLATALAVFMLTENSNFIRYTKVYIPAEQAIVKQYVKDLENWRDFYIFSTNSDSLQTQFEEQTGQLHWKKGSFEGDLSVLPTSHTDSLHVLNEAAQFQKQLYFHFKDSAKGVVVSLKEQGSHNWKSRIVNYFQSISADQSQRMVDQSLVQLKRKLQDELSLYTLQTSTKLYKIPSANYLYKTLVGNQQNWEQIKRNSIADLLEFARENQIKTFGFPFVLYKTSPFAEQVIAEVGIALNQELYVHPVSDIQVGSRVATYAQRVDLTGDFKYIAKAYTEFKKMPLLSDKSLHTPFIWMEEWQIDPKNNSKPSEFKSAVYRLYTAEEQEIPLQTSSLSES